MTEHEWNVCCDPTPMWLYWHRNKRDYRKLQLLACACLRRAWELLADSRSRTAIEVAERHADGQTSDEELTVAIAAALEGWGAAAETAANEQYGNPLMRALPEAGMAAWQAIETDWQCIRSAARAIALFAASEGSTEFVFALNKESTFQCQLFRCIVGNPFQKAPAVDLGWMEWKDGYVANVARKIYERRLLPSGTLDYPSLVKLAESLEQAGCRDESFLTHCRDDRPHVRGCWVIDLLLSKDKDDAKTIR